MIPLKKLKACTDGYLLLLDTRKSVFCCRGNPYSCGIINDSCTNGQFYLVTKVKIAPIFWQEYAPKSTLKTCFPRSWSFGTWMFRQLIFIFSHQLQRLFIVIRFDSWKILAPVSQRITSCFFFVGGLCDGILPSLFPLHGRMVISVGVG